MTIVEERIRSYLQSQRGPRYLKIAEAIAMSIDAGELSAGTRLPTHRALAEAVGVSVQTVSFAYAHAEQEGYVYARVGSGTYVGHRRTETEAEFLRDPVPETEAETLVDLSIASAVAGSHQQQAFRETLAELAGNGRAEQLINVVKPFAGLPEHRHAARHWLRYRGIEADPEQVCICNGATHALLIAISSLVKPGGLVACEALVDHGLISLARTLNFRLEGIPLDEQGMMPEELEQCCQQKQLSAICITPSMHNPTTATMSDQRRQAIAAIAARYRIPVVEDDVFGPLLSNGEQPIATYIPELSYYVTSFTKSVASGLRVGYLIPPKSEFHQVIGRLRASSWMATPMSVEVASQWITRGQTERLIRWHRQELGRRQQLAAELLGDFDFAAHPQGPLLWLQLPESWRAEAFIAQARARNVSITPPEPFVVGHRPAPHAVRISLASAESGAQLRQGLTTLAELLRQAPVPSFSDRDIY